jgi:hypothetical protein
MATPRSRRFAGAERALRHDPDGPHDSTCFQVGTGLRSYSSHDPLGADLGGTAPPARRGDRRKRAVPMTAAWARNLASSSPTGALGLQPVAISAEMK